MTLLFTLRPSAFIAVVLLLTLLSCRGYSQGGPQQQIVALCGDDVILPCFLKTPMDASNLQLEWARTDLTPGFIYVWQKNKENVEFKQASYVGRTSLSFDKLKHGDVSLTLSKVKLSDEGPYRCLIPQLGQESYVHLSVGSISTPVIELTSDAISGRRVLQCESAGWYPEPELLWLDSEENLLSAGPTEALRGPDDLYNISSRVTVEKRHSNKFTCRVQQKNINQSRETQIHVSGDAISDSVVLWIIVGVACLLSIIVAVVWKRNQTEKRNSETELKEESQIQIPMDNTESRMREIKENSTSDQLENDAARTVTSEEEIRQNKKNEEGQMETKT